MGWISPHYTHGHLNDDVFESRVAVYEDQVRGWFLDQARILERNSNHAGFVLLLVVLSYVEGHAIFMRGEDSKDRSKEFFREGFKNVFNPTGPSTAAIDWAIDTLYSEVRCGLFHTGMTRGKVILSGAFDSPVSIEGDQTQQDAILKINPHKMLDRIEVHLSDYVTRLRNPEEQTMRYNFDKAWKLRMRIS